MLLTTPSALLSPFQIYPFVGIAVSAWFRALGTANILHRRVRAVLVTYHNDIIKYL